MNKEIVLIILAFFLASCASNPPAVPRPFEGSSNIFKVTSNGTVEIKGSNLKNQPTYWVFVRCAHWSGCYMRCQGPVLACKSIVKKMGLKVSHVLTNKNK